MVNLVFGHPYKTLKREQASRLVRTVFRMVTKQGLTVAVVIAQCVQLVTMEFDLNEEHKRYAYRLLAAARWVSLVSGM